MTTEQKADMTKEEFADKYSQFGMQEGLKEAIKKELLADLRSVIRGVLPTFLTWLEKEGYNVDFEWDDTLIDEFLNNNQ